MAIIYKITNPNNQVYIGSSVRELRFRKAEHKYGIKRNRKGVLYDSFNLYGFENHDIEVISNVCKDDRLELEHFIIQEHKTELNEVSRYNNTATGKIWVNNGEKEFQIYPENLKYFHNISKGRSSNNLGRKKLI